MFVRLILLTFLFTSQPIWGQGDRVYWNYDISHGLPTNAIYHGFVDSKNRIWFGSDKGATCYNGNTFKTYNVDDGLAENTVIRCYEDSRGRIWFQHTNKLPSYFKNGKIVRLKTKNKTTLIEAFSNLVEFKNGDLAIGGLRDIIIIKPDDKVEYREKKTADHCITLFEKDNKLHYLRINNERSIVKELNDRGIPHVDEGNIHSDFSGLTKYLLETATVFRSIDYMKNYLKKPYYSPQNFIEIYPITGKTYHIVEHHQFVYIGSEKGLFKFKINGAKLEFAETLISNSPIVSVCFDKDGNVWCTSIKSGLYFFSGLKYQFSPFPEDKRLLKIKKINNKILLCGQSNWIYSFENGVFTKKMPWSSKDLLTREITDFYELENFIILVSGGNILIRNKKNNTSVNHQFLNQFPRIFVDPKDNNSVYLAGYSHINKLSLHPKQSFQDRTYKTISRITQLAFFNNRIIAGTPLGIYDCTSENQFPFHPRIFENSRINSLKVVSGKLIIGTADKGLYVFDGKNFKQVSIAEGLLSNTVLGIYASEAKNCIWVHSDLGLQKYDVTKTRPNAQMRLDLKTPFKIDEISDIIEHQNQLLLVLNTGVLTLPLKQDFRTKKLPFFIENIFLGNVIQNFNSQNIFTTKSKDISFNLETVNHSAHSAELFYRINNGKWVINESGSFNFSSLSAGKYTFEFKATSPFYKTAFLSPIQIVIEREWYQSNWFFLLVFIASLLVVGLFVRWRITKVQSKKQRFLSNELMALQSQMNPHFTFNSLNSIQSYLSTNDKRSAQIYLADFAILMRKILDQAKISLISIKEEVDFLDQYLNLEKRRLNGSFEYTITVDESINDEQRGVPTLMLQPFVENAIWHGVAALDYPGCIDVTFSQDDINIICEIIDNGNGLENNQSKKPYHKSTGIINCKERMKLFKELHKKEMSLVIFDRKENNSHGVCVRLAIPKITI